MVIAPPSIRRAPLGPQTQPRMVRHDIVCVHTMAGYLTSTDPFFRTSNGAGYDGTESHYGVGGRWGPDLGGGWDGAVWQWQDLTHTADANYQGNGRVISIETADNAVRPIAPWTPAQVSALIRLIAWLCSPAAHAGCPASWTCRREGIPAVLVPDTQPGRRGLAYHAQGAAEHVAGEWWSTTRTKDCPTASRIAQFRTTVIPGVQQLLDGKADEEDLMPALTDQEQKELLTRTRHIDQMLSANLSALLDDEGNLRRGIDAATTAILEGLKTLPTADLPDETIAQLGAEIGQAVPHLDANAVITALRDRITAAA